MGDNLAVKIISLGDEDNNGLQDIVREIDVLKSCNHPNVVSYFGSCWTSSDLWVFSITFSQQDIDGLLCHRVETSTSFNEKIFGRYDGCESEDV